MLNELRTEFYELHILDDDQKDVLARYGPGVVCSDGVIPNVYGIYNRQLRVYEHYCANLPQAMSIITALQEGIEENRERAKPKEKSKSETINLRGI